MDWPARNPATPPRRNVARIIECIVADLADPVADHGEVHFAVIANSGVVFARAIAQHRFAESPVAAARNEAPAVDPDAQLAAVFAVSQLAHAGLEAFLSRSVSAGLERRAARRRDADRHSQQATTARDLEVQRGMRRRIELDLLPLACGDVYALLERRYRRAEIAMFR